MQWHGKVWNRRFSNDMVQQGMVSGVVPQQQLALGLGLRLTPPLRWLASHLTAVHSILLRSVQQLWSAKWSEVCILGGGVARHRGAGGGVASDGGQCSL